MPCGIITVKPQKNVRMSNQEDYLNRKEVIEAISDECTVYPSIPVGVALQEAENLYHYCQDDQQVLVQAGLNWELVDDLPIRTSVCRVAQSLWMKECDQIEDVQVLWKERSKRAYDLRAELLHYMRFAYRSDEHLSRSIAHINEGNSHSGMIQDLNDLAVVGKANPAPLEAIDMDLIKLDQAASLSAEMADLFARANAEKSNNNEKKIFRDKAYTHLKEAVDEIRDYGKFVFWRDLRKRRHYISQYRKKH